MSPFALLAPRYVERGYSIVPIMPDSKSPGLIRGREWRLMSDWPRFAERQPSKFELEVWRSYPDAGIGVVCGGPASGHLIGVDVDTDDAIIRNAILSALPPTTVIKRGAKGETRFFRGPSIEKSKSWRLHGDVQVADLIGPGRQSVLPPSVHPTTGKPYFWIGQDALEDIDAGDLPELTTEHIAAIDEALRPLGYSEPVRRHERTPEFVCDDKRGREYGLGALDGAGSDVAKARTGTRNDTLFKKSAWLGNCGARRWLSEDEAATVMWDSCVANSLIADEGERQFWATFNSGLRKGLKNPAPDPRERLLPNPEFAARIAALTRS